MGRDQSPSPGRLRIAVALAVAALAGAADDQRAALRDAFDRDVHPVVERYCADCHDAERARGGVNLAYYGDGDAALATLGIWHRVGRKIAAHAMPPEDKPQPSDDERRRLLAWLGAVRELTPPDPGPVAIRRLSRTEYARTVRDLFGADVDAGAGLSEDSPGAAFDNSIPPLLMEQYLLAADAVLDRLFVAGPLHRTWTADQLAVVRAGAAEAPAADAKRIRFAEPGEVWTTIDAPVDGAYTIRIAAGADQAGSEPARLGVRVGDRVVAELKATARSDHPATLSCRCDLASGRTRVAIVFMNPTVADARPVDAAATPATKPQPPAKPGAPRPKPKPKPESAAPDAPPASRAVVIESLEIVGPPTRPPGEVQRRLLGALPGDRPKRDAARAVLAPLVARAWRRPPRDAEVEGVLRVFDLADAQDEDFVDAVKLALKAVLVSPQFLYRAPVPGADEAPGAIVPVVGHELATRLSYFLWATMPDEELTRAAAAGALREPDDAERQARRLIADPRSRALAETFAASWLGVDKLAQANVDATKFPQLTPALRQAMAEEALATFEHLLRDGGSVLDLIDCDYAYVNALTAKLYGVGDVAGAAMRKVALTDANRGGLIAMPAILTLTSRPDRTSPVKRGRWLLDTLFDAAPPPPPPNVPGLDRQAGAADAATLTLRGRTERHRTDPACAACHRAMDPLGFGLENFDAIGRWRTRDDVGLPVDAAGALPDGRAFATPAALKRLLLTRKDEFVRAFIARLMAFALGRGLGAYDELVVDRLSARAAERGYRLDAIVVDVATSYPFLHRRSVR